MDDKETIDRLNTRITQLKQDLGHSRNNGYVVRQLREAIDKAMAEVEADADPYLPGLESLELTRLRWLQRIAYSDNADLFGEPK